MDLPFVRSGIWQSPADLQIAASHAGAIESPVRLRITIEARVTDHALEAASRHSEGIESWPDVAVARRIRRAGRSVIACHYSGRAGLACGTAPG